MDTGREALHTGVYSGKWGRDSSGGELGRDSRGRNARCGWRGGRQQITLPCVYLCNYLACPAHVPQNLKCNKKEKKWDSEICNSTNGFGDHYVKWNNPGIYRQISLCSHSFMGSKNQNLKGAELSGSSNFLLYPIFLKRYILQNCLPIYNSIAIIYI